ncbi:N-acetylmuramoyl-L-alanine amidase [Lachnospiraceae bacterium KHCPX20]|nr:N-acetylmuramoyl-L-alanine amidase [Lachnospiraceae bacterium KHCPX20]
MKKRKKVSRAGQVWQIVVYSFALIGVVSTIIFFGRLVTGQFSSGAKQTKKVEKPQINVRLLDINPYSRPGNKLEHVKGVVIHYTANPGSTAQQNRDYFEGLKDSHLTHASSHFVVGIDGEIVQCIPTAEQAYASNERNEDTVAIECCHPDESGKFSKDTYSSVVALTAYICRKYHLSSQDVIRHYDITGKLCPKYYVENEGKWDAFKKDVAEKLGEE